MNDPFSRSLRPSACLPIGLLLLVALSLLSACTGTEPETCVPGAVAACACSGQTAGVQTCNAQGTFGTCECSSVGTDTSDTSDAPSDVPQDVPDVPAPDVQDTDAGSDTPPILDVSDSQETSDTPDTTITTDAPDGDSSGTIVDIGDSGLPVLPPLTGLTSRIDEDNVAVHFNAFEGAQDYRIYELPAAGEIAVDAQGNVVITDALYRCAGERHSPVNTYDAVSPPGSDYSSVRTVVEGTVFGVQRDLQGATLGYVYRADGPDRIAVYGLGDPSPTEVGCWNQVWRENRLKVYTTSTVRRQALLDAHWRDDGVAFYVPSTPDSTMNNILERDVGALYYLDQESGSYSGGGTEATAFSVLSEVVEGTEALMRVHYEIGCGGNTHDELVVGSGAFARARFQGPQPWTGLVYSGFGDSATLVVEALDGRCPYQGHFGPTSDPGGGPENIRATLSLSEIRAAALNGEVFINGQAGEGDGLVPRPQAIARSFLNVERNVKTATLDWYENFDTAPNFQLTDTDPFDLRDYYTSEQFTMDLEDGDFWSYGVEFGEFWVSYADWGAGAKVRLAPITKPLIADDSYLHVTMSVDALTTSRRYPQIIISDQDVAAPIQHNLVNGRSLFIQTFRNWPAVVDVQLCDHRTWEVNDHCPNYSLQTVQYAGEDALAPLHQVEGGADQSHRFDVYASTSRVYVFVDNKPYGCAEVDAPLVAGPATVTFGDVQYHAEIDYIYGGVSFPQWWPFASSKLRHTRRHFDNLGYAAGLPAPSWNHQKFPCTTEAD